MLADLSRDVAGTEYPANTCFDTNYTSKVRVAKRGGWYLSRVILRSSQATR